LLLAHWAKLQVLEKQAQATNQRIGVLIDLRLNSTRQALNVRVHAATSQGGLYDQAGMSVASRKGKPLTAASAGKTTRRDNPHQFNFQRQRLPRHLIGQRLAQ